MTLRFRTNNSKVWNFLMAFCFQPTKQNFVGSEKYSPFCFHPHLSNYVGSGLGIPLRWDAVAPFDVIGPKGGISQERRNTIPSPGHIARFKWVSVG